MSSLDSVRFFFMTAVYHRLCVVEMTSKVKITVLRRFDQSEVFPNKSPIGQTAPLKACELFKDGQEFMVEENGAMPKGFCTSAWNTIFGNVRTLAFGGNFPWYTEKGAGVSCCADGLRPVVFKLERV